jgi:hypothetical protein
MVLELVLNVSGLDGKVIFQHQPITPVDPWRTLKLNFVRKVWP